MKREIEKMEKKIAGNGKTNPTQNLL